jgi:hypothetical protein
MAKGPRGDNNHQLEECSKKSVQKGRSHFDARSVHGVREHGKKATCLREALRRRQGTPLAAFFNIPFLKSTEGKTQKDGSYILRGKKDISTKIILTC